MKNLALLFCIFSFVLNLHGQSTEKTVEGNISYITSQNVYVKFSSTKDIDVGDTLFIENEGRKIPALKVENISSISCVCVPLSNLILAKGDKVMAITREVIKKTNLQTEPILVQEPEKLNIKGNIDQKDTADIKMAKPEQDISGRFSVSSYSNFSNSPANSSQRFRYTLAANVDHISDSKFSLESYISFAHSNTNWDAVKSNIFNGLKIYNFALKYEPNETISLAFGRKINNNISNIGAIDGLQFEKRFKSFFLGGFAGSRPDYRDYSFNFNLLQFGAYGGNVFTSKNKGEMRTTIAIVEQRNNNKTDRRFAYLQHTNSLAKNLFFMGTAELDLYKSVNGQNQSAFNFTNLYFMLRYRAFRWASFSVTYSARKNIIYYETYKDYLERLIDDATMQGYSVQVNFRPFKFLSIGAKAGYRHRDGDARPTKNLNAYMTFTQIPAVKVTTTLSATLLETNYMNGKIYSVGLSRDIIPGKIYCSVDYRLVNYKYTFYDESLVQHVGDINLSWRMMKKVSLSFTYEGTFEKSLQYNRIYLNLSSRF